MALKWIAQEKRWYCIEIQQYNFILQGYKDIESILPEIYAHSWLKGKLNLIQSG